MSRIAYVEFGPTELTSIFRLLDGHQRGNLEGLPLDARVVGFWGAGPFQYGQPEPRLRVFFESADFADVEATGLIPVILADLKFRPSGGMDEYHELQRTVTLLSRSLADSRALINKLIAGFPHDLGEITE
jgi:hypothetical protein